MTQLHDRNCRSVGRILVALTATVALLLAIGCSREGAEDATIVTADEDILLVEDVQEVSGIEDVSVVELTVAENAPYQAAFERSDGQRIAILTVQDAAEYPSVVANVDGNPLDLGEEAVVKGAAVYFRQNDRTVTLYAVMQAVEGGQAPALTRDEIVELARIAADRS